MTGGPGGVFTFDYKFDTGIANSDPSAGVFRRAGYRDGMEAAAAGVETVVAGRVKRRQAGLAILEVGSAQLAAADPGGEDPDFYVCIRGEDVTVEKGRAEQSSARNHLPGIIVDAVAAGILTKVILDVGFELVALVTRQAVADLELKKGAEVFAVFKASAVHLIRRGS